VAPTFTQPRPPPCDLRFLLSEFQLFSTHARTLAAETLKLERTLSDLVSQGYGLPRRGFSSRGKSPRPAWPSDPPQRDLEGKGEPAKVRLAIGLGAKTTMVLAGIAQPLNR